MKKNKKYFLPTILAIMFTLGTKLGIITPKEINGNLISFDDNLLIIVLFITSYIGFYVMVNGPINLKKEDKTEEFRKNKKP
jgi:hypothetical protein